MQHTPRQYIDMALALGSALDLSNATQEELDGLAQDYALSQPTTLPALFDRIRHASNADLKRFADVNIFTLTGLQIRFGRLALVRDYARNLYWGRVYRQHGHVLSARRMSGQAAATARTIRRIIASEAA